jgi:hypothetical protein
MIELSATHYEILKILDDKSNEESVHINYLTKCLGYSLSNPFDVLLIHNKILDIKNKGYCKKEHQFIDRFEMSRWIITNKGKRYLEKINNRLKKNYKTIEYN